MESIDEGIGNASSDDPVISQQSIELVYIVSLTGRGRHI
jgi:hypothetical protein